ncbi:Lrp/AsnC family transcriptional regulator [Streptomyces iranensis]|uniref:Lrp/AsnC family transcriptional regulator for asnA, asnC and gidA n=1 Tax=Streptomyces iranensis TaxID=576784 RepID=A0A060ZTR2_9ACTN|nr:Lrp/AsnC family transcriptional regulator [Streptomyces iranensis]MBP2060971.1 Lrp/AsnC family transcriptional regulator for asnA, asnC and gidA [Streptomyces iranensis]CDR06442.1 transcriptional regulator, AsnC family [Streptomyces iranensis]
MSTTGDDRTKGPEQEPGGEAAGPDRPLDELDHAIVGLLQQDGRMAYRQIARELDVSEGTVRFRVNRLQTSGVLTVIAIADPHRMGYQVLAFSLLSVDLDRQKEVVDTLAEWDEITYISSCTGRADLYVQLVCRDHDHMWHLLYERLPAVEGVTKAETFMELKMHKVSYGYR